ncbi:MAG: hypothetical protein IJB49_06330 [Clostridia bacterium]|nr:hypothetical protein [Clostridia bacterium]
MEKRSELLTVILFCVIVGVLAVLFVALPDRDFSEQENRALAEAPKLDKESFFSGEFGKETNVYFADQFPFRDQFVKLKSATELGFFKKENNGVLYSYDQLAVRDFNAYRSRIHISENTDRLYPETIKAQLGSVEKLGQSLEIPLVTVIPPRTVDVADSVFDYDRPDGDIAFELMNETLSEKAGYIDTLSLLREKYESGEYVSYRTDHHWTTLGAYYVYCEIMKELGVEDKIIPKEEFEIEQIEDFSGTTAARANFPFYKKDVLELWHLPDDGEYKIIADGEELSGFYSREYLESSDKYSVFIDGTHNKTEITKSGGERKTLLIAKDSFANSLIPFLAREFDIIALNLQGNTMLSLAVAEYDPAAVLIVYNTENLITTGSLGNVK